MTIRDELNLGIQGQTKSPRAMGRYVHAFLPASGLEIGVAIHEAVVTAKEVGNTVLLVFNGTAVEVEPTHTTGDVFANWKQQRNGGPIAELLGKARADGTVAELIKKARVEFSVAGFPVLYGSTLKNALKPKSTPWTFVETFRAQAERNHGQTLEELARRGGLSPVEMWLAAHGRTLRESAIVTEETADAWLREQARR